VAAPVALVGLTAGALAVAGAYLLRGDRARALALLAALVLTPGLLAAELLATGWGPVPGGIGVPVGVAAAAVGLAVVAALAVLLVRHPDALAPLVVAALPFRVPLQVGGQSASLLVPLYLVIGAGGIAHAWVRLRASEGRRPALERPAGRIELALSLVLLLYALQSSYSADPARALQTMVFFYLPFAILLKLLTGVEWSRRVVGWCFAVAVSLALLFAAIGFWEWGTRRLLLNPKVIASNQFESYFRVNSLFFDPNIYGRFLAVVMLAVTGLLLWSRRRGHVLLATLALAVLWAALVLTFSQSSFSSLLVGLVLLAALRWRARSVAGLALVGVVAAVGLIAVAPGLLRLDLGSLSSLDRASSGRIELMRGGLSLWLERPLLGNGSGSFSARYREREDASSAQAVSASHTIPITIAAEQGLLGLVAYVLLMGAAAGLLFGGIGALRGRAPPPAGLVVRAVLAAAFTALFFHTLLYAAFLEDPIAWTLLGAAVGVRASGAGLSGLTDRDAAPRRLSRA